TRRNTHTMPLVKIDMIRGVRTPEEIKKLADVYAYTGLSIPRTDKLILIQIFQQGRDAEKKQAIYAALAERLENECGVPKTDLVVSCSANTKEDWSFGLGRAQFLTGEL
ncbi:unnamed protein product, partial [Aureobasidium pullulans]